MSTIEFITALFYHVDEPMRAMPKHPEAHLWPSEVVTLGLLNALKCESMGMLGISAKLQQNGLHDSPTTQPRRSPPMRVKLQLVMCSDDGQEETITDLV